MMAGVLVFGEVADGGLSPVSLEVATAGAALAEALGEPLLGALVGDDAGAAEQFRGGFASLYLVGGRPLPAVYRAGYRRGGAGGDQPPARPR